MTSRRGRWTSALLAGFVGLAGWSIAATPGAAAQPGGAGQGAVGTATQPATPTGNEALAKRGAYLVLLGGCNDCHTPWKMGANGPEPDLTRLLSGHPAAMQLPPAPAPSGPWGITAAMTMTAWSGPWGVSYSANLTPDPGTGLGKWTEQQFVDAMRSGRHLGRGRPILPPMPWPNLAKAEDSDLKALFVYLRSVPAIDNRVPEPQPPAAGAPAGQK